jgi:hypothetical protein
MTWIDIASDSVKIGLGALIAGLFTLLGGAKTHRQKLDEEYSRRRRDSLEKLSSDFDRIALTGMERLSNWAAIHQIGDSKEGKNLAAAVESELMTDATMLKCLYELHSIEARLALLGFPHIAEAVEAYRIIFTDVDPDENQNPAELQRFQELETKLHSQRTMVITLMGKAYQKA